MLLCDSIKLARQPLWSIMSPGAFYQEITDKMDAPTTRTMLKRDYLSRQPTVHHLGEFGLLLYLLAE